MSARALSKCVALAAFAVGCASAQPAWRHVVALRPSNVGPALVLRLSKATVRCPLQGLRELAENPRRLRPDDPTRPELLRKGWHSQLERMTPLFASEQDYAVPRREYRQQLLIGDLLHAGTCSVLDHKHEVFVSEVVVLPYDDRVSSGRIFQFSDGRSFFQRRDAIR